MKFNAELSRFFSDHSFIGFIIFLALSLSSVTAEAFINIESLRQTQGQGPHGALNLSANGAKGNTNRSLAEVSSLNLYHRGAQEYLVLAHYRYGESAGVKDVNHGHLHARLTHRLSDEDARFLGIEGFVQHAFNEFRRLESRQLVGSNLRWQLFDSEQIQGFLGTGFFYEHEVISDAIEDERDIRGNFYFSGVYSASRALDFSMILYYQPLPEEMSDYRVQFDLGIETKLTERTRLHIKYAYQFDSEPPPLVQKTDESYILGIGIRY